MCQPCFWRSSSMKRMSRSPRPRQPRLLPRLAALRLASRPWGRAYSGGSPRECSTTVSYCTVEPVLKDHPIGHRNVVSQDRWSLVTVSVYWNVGPSAKNGWLLKTGGLIMLMAVVSQDRFHCTKPSGKVYQGLTSKKGKILLIMLILSFCLAGSTCQILGS